MRALALSAFIVAFVPQAALADCQGSHAVDRCVVGTWKMTQNGAQIWMEENIHGAHLHSIQASNNTVTFSADGTFQTGQVDIEARVVDDGRASSASAHLQAQSSGTWAAHDGHLDMCPTHTVQSGSLNLKDAHGHAITAPMARVPQRNGVVSYTCGGSTMTITQPMPRNTVATSIYAKLR
jgi:hypothetical protein